MIGKNADTVDGAVVVKPEIKISCKMTVAHRDISI